MSKHSCRSFQDGLVKGDTKTPKGGSMFQTDTGIFIPTIIVDDMNSNVVPDILSFLLSKSAWVNAYGFLSRSDFVLGCSETRFLPDVSNGYVQI